MSPERASSPDGKGLAQLGARASDPTRRSGFQEAMRQMQARQSRDEAGARPPGLEERPQTGAEDRAQEEQRAPDQARDSQEARQQRRAAQTEEAQHRDNAEETARDAAAAARADETPAGDEEATEAAKAAGATQGSAVRAQNAVAASDQVEEANEGEESAWARFLERTGGQSKDTGDGQTMEFSSSPEEVPVQPGLVAPEVSFNPFDMLDVSEVMDPDLQVDPMPTQLIERLQQAMQTVPNPALLDEAGEVVLPQVVRGLVALARDGASEMRLQLQPADLGDIELRVRAIEGVIRGEITVQNQEVRHLLESQLNRLRTALADQGFDLQEFSVGVAHDGRFSQPESGGRDASGNGNGTPWRNGDRDGGDTAAAVESAAPAASSVGPADLGDHEVNYVI